MYAAYEVNGTKCLAKTKSIAIFLPMKDNLQEKMFGKHIQLTITIDVIIRYKIVKLTNKFYLSKQQSYYWS